MGKSIRKEERKNILKMRKDNNTYRKEMRSNIMRKMNITKILAKNKEKEIMKSNLMKNKITSI